MITYGVVRVVGAAWQQEGQRLQVFKIQPTRRRHSHQTAMARTTKRTVDKVSKHREDGEEAIKRSSKVVSIDSGRNRGSVQVISDSKSQLQKNKSVRRK